MATALAGMSADAGIGSCERSLQDASYLLFEACETPTHGFRQFNATQVQIEYSKPLCKP